LSVVRLVRSKDFERVLRRKANAKTTHFALHYLADRPSAAMKPASKMIVFSELSTDEPLVTSKPVDDLVEATEKQLDITCQGSIWLGTVVPKRYARRAVTRNLIKRQIKTTVSACMGSLAQGLWVVRLRSSFSRDEFLSASSPQLKAVVRDELALLVSRVVSAETSS
jgi:ribonuclease P protein component